ncbi:thioredoxin family protein [uncultured Chitinophaga sp.]|uniref:DUF1223 domain-containing protein n=1 Tax=uncultured Chitinophaga sp. TaxID=339340 RepID=UPI0025DB60FC|nr:DUF1223 domain-containing protein [uncultured Chitinophaga sp.]
MKRIFQSIALLGLFTGTAAFLAYEPKVILNQPDDKGFAVVELFTSEGCSSCPPADKILEQLEQQHLDGQLYVLAFHVDYWDHQGWKDRFSDKTYSLRQQQYASWLNVRTVYTPQLIVNGSSEHIGSDASAVSNVINHQLQQPASRSLKLEGKVDGKRLTVQHNLNSVTGSNLVVTLVQRQARSRVKAGENAGSDLAHVQIVRAMKQVPPETGKDVVLSLPSDYDKQQWEVIGFVQDRQTGKITDAARVSL